MGTISFHKHFFSSLDNEVTHQQMPSINGALQNSEFFATKTLIILDENSYMAASRKEVISSCNGILHTIRDTARLYPSFKQYVSVICYDSYHTHYILQNVPVMEIQDLTMQDYHPGAITSQNNAGGLSVRHINKHFTDSCAVGVVTIITDGYGKMPDCGNSQLVEDLTQGLQRDGWAVAIFMIDNEDVEEMSAHIQVSSDINECFAKVKET